MINLKSLLLLVGIVALLDEYAESADSSNGGNSDDSNIPMIASGKRQHNIMRFGKRPSGGHSLIHFGKRGDSKSPQHSFLYFGKRDYDEEPLNSMIQYLRDRDNSYKRGHSIMRFGKRSGDDALLFGDDPEDYDDGGKRSGHSMLYFGKRGGSGHSMMYFGKRYPGHSKLFFGKRDESEDGTSDDDYENDVEPFDKRAHSMIHFGKREFDEPIPLFWSPEASEKRQHNYLRFGKKTEGSRKGSHSMIHFGKRDEEKRAHSMIHFGKRSVDQNDNFHPATNRTSGIEADAGKHLPRMKREAKAFLPPGESFASLVEDLEAGEKELPDMDVLLSPEGIAYRPAEAYNSLQSLDNEDMMLSMYPEYQPIKKGDSKNVFLRFG